MRVLKYTTEYDSDRKPLLVREGAFNYPSLENLNMPELIVQFCRDFLRMELKTEEYVYELAFDAKHKLVGLFELSHGCINLSICEPREIFRNALLVNAHNIVIVHNHPSGDCSPSKEDNNAYNRIKEAGKVIGCSLKDSIIIGNGEYYSFSEHP